MKKAVIFPMYNKIQAKLVKLNFSKISLSPVDETKAFPLIHRLEFSVLDYLRAVYFPNEPLPFHTHRQSGTLCSGMRS